MMRSDPKALFLSISDFERLWDRFIEWMKSPETGVPYSPHTIASYNRSFRQFVQFLHEMQVDDHEEINLLLIRLFAQKLAQSNSSATISLKLASISSFFDWCYLEGIVRENPVRDYVNRQKRLKRRTPRKTRLPTVLNAREVDALIEECRTGTRYEQDKYAAFISLLLDTGLRVSEALSLTLEDGLKFLNKEPVLIIGKGNKERRVKTLGHYTDLLENYFEVRDFLQTANAPLFPSRVDLSKPPKRSTAYRVIKEHLVQAGINKPQMGPHLLRHTAASLMLREGWSLTAVRDALGHADISITERYLHVVDP